MDFPFESLHHAAADLDSDCDPTEDNGNYERNHCQEAQRQADDRNCHQEDQDRYHHKRQAPKPSCNDRLRNRCSARSFCRLRPEENDQDGQCGNQQGPKNEPQDAGYRGEEGSNTAAPKGLDAERISKIRQIREIEEECAVETLCRAKLSLDNCTFCTIDIAT